jgi:hypothetical protein
MLGGYLREMPNLQTVTSAVNQPQITQAMAQMPFPAPAATAQRPTPTPESSPVLQAAAQQISQGDNVIHVNISMNNTFNGGTPGTETVNQIETAGQRMAGDFKDQVQRALEEIMRDERRVKFA